MLKCTYAVIVNFSSEPLIYESHLCIFVEEPDMIPDKAIVSIYTCVLFALLLCNRAEPLVGSVVTLAPC